MKLMQYTGLAYAFVIVLPLCAEGFVADTSVHNFGSKPATIKQLCDHICHGKQQFVSSWHEKKGTWASQQIRRAGCGTTNCTITITFDDNPAHDITCSPIQLFYDAERTQWIEAYKLHVGDRLCTESGNTIQLAGLCVHEQESILYALRVKKNHTFCVGYYRVLTHNKHFPLLPLAIMARIGVAFGTGAAAGGAACGWLGPITCAGGFTIGGIVGALATCAAVGHELYHYRMQIDTYKIERALSPSNIHPSQAIEAPSKGAAFITVPLPPQDIREQKGCGHSQPLDMVHTGGCGYADQPVLIATGCGRTPQHLVISELSIGCGGIPTEFEDQPKGVGCFPGQVVSAFAQESGQAATPVKTIEDLARECKPGKETKGKSRQYEKNGGFEQAEQDFETLGPSNVRPIPTGKAGTLPDGRTVNVRTESSFETPTLEVLNKETGRKIKIRYIDSK
jgi:hypothetical protein